MDFTVKVTKLTNESLMQRACSFTTGKSSKLSLTKIYDCEHSPIRTQLFWIEMENIPSFVSVHFVRHKIGVEHFVKSNREDRGGADEVTRKSPINHAMLINAQALITMARKRLCHQAHADTQFVMQAIVSEIKTVDPDLAKYLVPECVYRKACHELKCCGYIYTIKH